MTARGDAPFGDLCALRVAFADLPNRVSRRSARRSALNVVDISVADFQIIDR